MKLLDKWLQRWRTQKVVNEIHTPSTVLDIGCYDALVFEKLGDNLRMGVGIDPLIAPLKKSNYLLINGWFPNDLPLDMQQFDAVTLIAVLEHIPEGELERFIHQIHHHLKPNGKVILTVPDPFVDTILHWLIKFKLLDGMSVDEHHGFDVRKTSHFFSQAGFTLVKHATFQLGLNNVFVFTKN